MCFQELGKLSVPAIFLSLQPWGTIIFNAAAHSKENILTSLADKPQYMSDTLLK